MVAASRPRDIDFLIPTNAPRPNGKLMVVRSNFSTDETAVAIARA